MNTKIDYDKDIDRNIRELIRWINEETKFETLFSCSSHPEKKEFEGYVIFKYTPETALFLDKVLDRLVDIFRLRVTLRNGWDIIYYMIEVLTWYSGYDGKVVELKVDFTRVYNYYKRVEKRPVDDFEEVVIDFWNKTLEIMKEEYNKITK